MHLCDFLDYVSREQLLLHVTRSDNADTSVEHRLVWCPYVVSGATNNDDIEHLFAVALGKSVSVFVYVIPWVASVMLILLANQDMIEIIIF